MPLPTKTLEEHLQSIQSCGHRWRLLQLRSDTKQSVALDLPEWRIIPVRCKSKFCPTCRRKNFNLTRRKFAKIDVTTRWRFFTLTTCHAPEKSEEELLKLESDFRKLTKHLKRKYPDLKYFAVKEMSPSGMWHIHGIWNIFVDIKELSNVWQKYSGAYRIDLQKIKNPKGIVTYIFNYMMKKSGYFEESKMLYENGLKKFTTSWRFFTKDEYTNPYKLVESLELTTDELKSKILEITLSTNCTINDFAFQDYPYADDLIQECFYHFYCDPEQQQLQFEVVPEEDIF